MKKILYSTFLFAFLLSALTACNSHSNNARQPVTKSVEDVDEENEENEEYDGPAQRDQFEFERIKDPSLGYVPSERMLQAVNYTDNFKTSLRRSGRSSALAWVERGPIYDSTGPSNGNPRGGVNNPAGTYTSGRIAAILIDTLNDPTGNTAFTGGIDGGLWKCNNFLSPIPNWQLLNDRFQNLAVSSICQDPSTPSVMYFATGEATSNADAVYGGGIFKSTNAGASWTQLPTTLNFIRNFKIACDAAGNVFVAARPTTTPASQPYGLLRSNDKGASFTNITPATLTSSNAICTDIEISSTGKLHASFGYATSGTTTIVQHLYTATPATVTPATGWNTSTGIRSSGLYSLRLELATQADTLYAATQNSGANVDSIYKSVDGGATWTKQNTAALATGILNGQGWYNITLSINPSNSNEFLIGGLDAYKSVNSGVTIPTRMTFWVTSAPYVHADHHYMQWWNKGTESRVVIGCDGGVFYSNNGGTTFTDKNRNLSIKQFYAGAIHPAQGSSYLIAGAQDNGVHQLKNAGLSYSTEVTGGDGCFVHINQQNPLIQFGSYVYNQYRRSTDGGATWSSVNLSTTLGLFVNPFDYDDGQNTMYATYGARQVIRWRGAATSGTDTTILTLSALTKNAVNSTPTAYKVSPFTKDRVFIGGSTGKVLRLDNAGTVTRATADANVTDISGTNFPVSGYVSCVNTGSSDNYLVATFSSYGVTHVFFSSNAGTSWTAIDGTAGSGGLPDMPVRWAVFDPQNNNKLILATEAGVYTTDAVNGANTVWTPDQGFPTVRTDMLQLRLSDNTIVAATHGRGLFTAVIASTPEVRFSATFGTLAEGTSGTNGCRNYRDYPIDLSIISPPTGDATATFSVQAGNTAVQGSDFDFSTNGDFANPSKTLVFTNGVLAVKTLTIRVYDDAEVETTPESFTLSFNVSGVTNAIAGAYNSFTVSISDNDFAPSPYGNGTFTSDTVAGTSSTASIFRSDRLKNRLQTLYTAAELKTAGILSAGTITAIKLKVTTKNSTRPYSGFTISMANSSTTNVNTGYGSGTLTTVWSGDYSTVQGDNNFTFTTPFVWDGVSNVLVQYCFDNGTQAAAEAAADVMEVNIPSTTIYTSVYSNQTAVTATSGCSLGAQLITTARITATFTAFYGTPAAIALNSSRTEYFTTNSPTNDFAYYLPTGEVLASFKNSSMFSYGCTQVVIDRAGTGATSFWSNTDTTSFLMNKTFRVLPTTNSTSGSYEATFYFSAAEKQGWEAATKQSFSNIKVVKLPGQISSITPANPQTSTVQIITPTSVGSLGNIFFVTATFNTGFSGFGFGIPNGTLPISLLEFKGSLHGDNAFLEWTTSSEVNSKEFQIEKSYDGVNYRKFATVKAAGSSNVEHKYSLKDVEFAVDVNYYRLKMVDIDNTGKYSNVVVLKNPNSKAGISVVNNPFTNYIDVRFTNIAAGKVKLQLTDAAGKQIQSETIQIGTVQSIYHLVIKSTGISKGVYFLTADTDGKRYTMKVMKQ